MGKRDRTIGSAGQIIKMGRPFKNPPIPDEWHACTEAPEPTSPPSQETWNKVLHLMNGKSEPEAKQLIASLAVMAKEHRAANRTQEAETLESLIPPIRAYLNKVLPQRLAQRKGGVTVQ